MITILTVHYSVGAIDEYELNAAGQLNERWAIDNGCLCIYTHQAVIFYPLTSVEFWEVRTK